MIGMHTETSQLHARSAVLRSFETECYRICYALLGDERQSLLAAESALRELFRDSGFYRLDTPQQSRYMRKLAMRAAIRQHASAVRN